VSGHGSALSSAPHLGDACIATFSGLDRQSSLKPPPHRARCQCGLHGFPWKSLQASAPLAVRSSLNRGNPSGGASISASIPSSATRHAFQRPDGVFLVPIGVGRQEIASPAPHREAQVEGESRGANRTVEVGRFFQS